MTKDIFREMADQMRPSEETRAALFAALDGPAGGDTTPPAEPVGAALPPVGAPDRPPGRPAGRDAGRPAGRPSGRRPRRFSKPLFASALAATVAVALIAVAALPLTPWFQERTGGDDQTSGTISTAADYTEIYETVAALTVPERERSGFLDWLGDVFGGGVVTAPGGSVEDGATGLMDADVFAKAEDAGTEDFSKTNAQVEGIDEADLVKTDGESLFVAHGRFVSVVSAAGANSRETATLSLDEALAGWPSLLGASQEVRDSVQIRDLMVSDDTLAVMATGPVHGVEWTASDREAQERGVDWAPETLIILYDVSDPSNPRRLETLGQSGVYTDVRLMDGTVYLVSTHVVPTGGLVEETEPATYVPQVCDRDGARPVAADRIAIMPNPQTPAYAVVTATDLAARERLGDLSVLGGAEIIHMSPDNLYLAATQWMEDGDPVTDLARVALGGDELTVDAQGSVPGSLLNQFSMDEHEGFLRVVTQAWISEEMTGGVTRVSLRVLDSELRQAGEIDSLTTNEDVKAVRFMGDLGYVVTFAQTDPLFAVDLTDPTAPRVLSTLEIPGFSAYLHPWGDSLLLGLGQDGDEWGTTGGLKLSMFDVTDPGRVAEVATLGLTGLEDSGVLSDHHAVWADPQRDLIGFPAWGDWDDVFAVYEFADGRFKSKADLPVVWSPVDEAVYGGVAFVARGVRVGGDLYVCSTGGVAAYSLETFEPLAEVVFRSR